MSLWRRAIKFAARELVQAGCAEVGRHVGDAIGNLLGKRIDPTHGDNDSSKDDEDEDEKENDDG